jgi:hypothetical protein
MRHFRFASTLDRLERRCVLNSPGDFGPAAIASVGVIDGRSGSPIESQLASVSANMVHNTVAAYCIDVDWGDGTTSSFMESTGENTGSPVHPADAPTSPGYGSIAGEHTYTVAHDTQFVITVHLDAPPGPGAPLGESYTTTDVVQVHAADDRLAGTFTGTLAQGLASPVVVGTVQKPVSPWGAEPASDFRVVVWWGDGTAADQGAQVIDVGTPGLYNVVGKHAYAAAGTYTVTVLVLDMTTWTYFETTSTVTAS